MHRIPFVIALAVFLFAPFVGFAKPLPKSVDTPPPAEQRAASVVFSDNNVIYACSECLLKGGGVTCKKCTRSLQVHLTEEVIEPPKAKSQDALVVLVARVPTQDRQALEEIDRLIDDLNADLDLRRLMHAGELRITSVSTGPGTDKPQYTYSLRYQCKIPFNEWHTMGQPKINVTGREAPSLYRAVVDDVSKTCLPPRP